VFWIEDYHAQRFSVEGGLRLDWVERDPQTIAAGKANFTAFSASAALLYDFTPAWTMVISYS